MKFSLLSIVMLSTLTVSAQAMDLTQCLTEKGELSRETLRLLSQNTDLRDKLTTCEKRPQTPANSQELERIRLQNGELSRENLRLLSQNTDIRERLSSCEKKPQTSNLEIERLIRTNQDLSRDNGRLASTNIEANSKIAQLSLSNSLLSQRVIELQKALAAAQTNGAKSFVSIAGCTDVFGTVGNKFIAISSGRTVLESETNSKKELSKKYTCNYGQGIVSTEEIKSQEKATYCVAACMNVFGDIDPSFATGATGRNRTEATYNSLIAQDAAYTCSYGRTIYKCEY